MRPGRGVEAEDGWRDGSLHLVMTPLKGMPLAIKRPHCAVRIDVLCVDSGSSCARCADEFTAGQRIFNLATGQQSIMAGSDGQEPSLG